MLLVLYNKDFLLQVIVYNDIMVQVSFISFNGKVGNQVLCPHSRYLFWCNLFDIAGVLWRFFKPTSSSSSSSSTQFSQEWVCRKLVIKHSINPKFLDKLNCGCVIFLALVHPPGFYMVIFLALIHPPGFYMVIFLALIHPPGFYMVIFLALIHPPGFYMVIFLALIHPPGFYMVIFLALVHPPGFYIWWYFWPWFTLQAFIWWMGIKVTSLLPEAPKRQKIHLMIHSQINTQWSWFDLSMPPRSNVMG